MHEAVEARAIRPDGESFRVTVTTAHDGLLLEGMTGLIAGERLSLVLPDGQIHDIVVRWAVGDHVGARVLD
jgi:hypothetical protein